ncbi:WGR domain-containing protein [Bradyrhizobium sp. 159]|uniref:WGR domain-containing protein n=1 Tax=Bradyrhizobium sp. 159 TaxID=2782632 RepID=UPI001FF986C8|nr:WGR domain-containing protein [Bradyrhizobium sp. 159]
MARFYVLPIEPPLFGDTALLREWGRLGQRPPAPRCVRWARVQGRRGARGLARA